MKRNNLKRLLAKGAAFLSAVLLVNMFFPIHGRVFAADGKTEIGDDDITNVVPNQSGTAFSGELDYRIPSSITEENGIVTYDFSKVFAYYQDANGDWQTKGVSALDFSKFDLEGPIIIEGSYYYNEYKTLIDDFMNSKDFTELKNAGYPYWYTFDKNGVVELDYSAMFTVHDNHSDSELLIGADSYVVFSCELNKDAFTEAGGDYILNFISSPIESNLNPRVHFDPPKTLDRDIEVTKVCSDFDFDNGTVQFEISVKNKGSQTITTPIEIKDELDKGLSWVRVDQTEDNYITESSNSTTAVRYFSLNNLPAGDTTTIYYTCRLNSTFYSTNQTPDNTNTGNTVSATTIPEGGTDPISVELNDNGDTSIRVTPPNVSYDKISKDGSYSEGVYSWTVNINNGTNTLHSDLRDVVLTDDITYNVAENPELVDGKVTITNANNPSLSYDITGVSIESFKDPGVKLKASWFDNTDSDGIYIGDPKDSYKITYSTTTGDNLSQFSTNQSVTNVAALIDGTRRIGSVGKTLDGPSGFSLEATKDIVSSKVTFEESGNQTTINMPWLFTVYVPANFSDEIKFSDAFNLNTGMSFDFTAMSPTEADLYYLDDNGQEVAIPAKLSQETLSNGNPWIGTVIDKSDVTALQGKTIYWRVYTTATVPTSVFEKNEKIFHNEGRVNDKGLDAFYKTRGPVYVMNKHGVGFDETTDQAKWWLVYNADNTGHKLEAHNWTSIHIIDDLHGMEFLGISGNKDQVRAIINNQDGSPYYAYAHDLGNGTFEIIVDDTHPLKDANGNEYLLKDLIKNNERIVFEYRTHIPKSLYPIISGGAVENTATSTNVDDNGVTFTQDVSLGTINIDYPILEKTDVGPIHDYNEVDYVISVNPYSLNLSRDGSGSYLVVDTLGDNIDYVVDTLKVYEKKADLSNPAYVPGDTLYTLDSMVDDHVSAGTYEFTISGKDLVLRVPDGVELNISYTVRLTFATSAIVKNSAYMPVTYPYNMEDEAGRIITSREFKISSSSAGSRPNYAVFYIDKVGENDPSKFLGNIKFIAKEYDLDGNATGNTFTGTTTSTATLAADAFVAPVGQEEKAPRENYVYVVYEDPTQIASEGYTISSEKIAFYVPSNSNYKVNQEAFTKNLGLTVQSVVKGKHFLFVNDVNSLTINKAFNPVGADASDVTFTIKGTGSTVYAEKTIERSGNKFMVSNLPIGTYEITETSTARGYEVLGSTISVTVANNKSITVSTPSGVKVLSNSNNTPEVSIEVLNEMPPKGYITINKTISGPVTESDIEGLTFTITYKDADDNDVTITKTIKNDFDVTKNADGTYTCTLKDVIEVPDASKSVTVEETLYDLSAEGFTSSVVSSRVGTTNFAENEAGQTVASVSMDSSNATNFDFQDDYTKPSTTPEKTPKPVPEEPETTPTETPSSSSNETVEETTPTPTSTPVSSESGKSTSSDFLEPTTTPTPTTTDVPKATTTPTPTEEVTSTPTQTPSKTTSSQTTNTSVTKTGESRSYTAYIGIAMLLLSGAFAYVGWRRKEEY